MPFGRRRRRVRARGRSSFRPRRAVRRRVSRRRAAPMKIGYRM